jgi:adenosylhomocysteine nucleosidase
MMHRRKIGVLFALPCEMSGLQRVLENSHVPSRQRGSVITWLTGQVDLLVLVSGVGPRRSPNAADALMWAGAECVLCAGLAAGLDPSAGVGDVVVANRVLSLDDTAEDVLCSRNVISSLPPSGAFGFPIRLCDLVTVGHVVCGRDEKADINKRTGAAALDMESYSAGEACRRRGVPFAAIRAISDTANQGLPQAVGALATTDSALRRTGMVLTSPQSWLSLLRLRGQARIASANLGEVLATMLVRMGSTSHG